MRLPAILAVVALLAGSVAARADGTGTQVTGGLFFGSNTNNYFDPAHGFVPAGYGNVAGTTVTIGSGVEFGFNDGLNKDTADFTGSSLSITDVDSANAANFKMTFTDPAFTGFTQLTGQDMGYTFSFSGDTLNVFYAGSLAHGTFSGTFSYATSPTATPEPSSLLLLGSSILGMAGVVRRRLS
jgi:hypothetical protein